MTILLIVLALAIGKIHGREQVASRIKPPQIPAPSYVNREPIGFSEHDGLQAPRPPARLYVNLPVVRNQPQVARDSDLNLPTITGTTNHPRLYTSAPTLPTMSRLNKIDAKNTIPHNNSIDGNEHNIYKLRTSPPLRTESTTIINRNVTSMDPSSTDIPEVVTLDERSNFNGDACGQGEVKVNGMCVPKDTK